MPLPSRCGMKYARSNVVWFPHSGQFDGKRVVIEKLELFINISFPKGVSCVVYALVFNRSIGFVVHTKIDYYAYTIKETKAGISEIEAPSLESRYLTYHTAFLPGSVGYVIREYVRAVSNS